MILLKHPDLMSDQELGEWVHRLVTLKEPESTFLDYKKTIATNSPSDKLEIAKDVSSFANERGGVVLYGIPQIEKNGEPVPADVDDVGMDPVPGLPEVIENVLVDALMPRLPELRVREVPLVHSPDKVVYLVWHPESWEAPHMIHTYKEKRYYRRGTFRAVPMEEGEIERLHLRRQARRTLADQFLKGTDFGELLFPGDQPLMRLIVCPTFPFEDRVDFSHEMMKSWLMRNTLRGDSYWLPFIQGVRLSLGLGWQGQVNYLEEFRLFRNGAASVYSDCLKVEDRTISGLRFFSRLKGFLDLVGRFYEQIGITGDILIDVVFFNMKGVKFQDEAHHHWPSYTDCQWHSDKLQFRVATSAVDLLTEDSRRPLERRIMDRLTQCFGEWTIPGYFR